MNESKTYEALYILRPDLEDEEVRAAARGVESLVTANEGIIVESEIWGKRRLAYKVKKFSEGHYVLLRFAAAHEVLDRLRNHFRLADPIIRYLIVRFDERTLRLEAEQKRRKEAELERNGALAARRTGERRDSVVSKVPPADAEAQAPTALEADAEAEAPTAPEADAEAREEDTGQGEAPTAPAADVENTEEGAEQDDVATPAEADVESREEGAEQDDVATQGEPE